MHFITYPVNIKNPGSIIPILFGIQWGLRSPKNSFTIYIDKISRERGRAFDLKQWLTEKGIVHSNFLQEKNSQLLLSFFGYFREGVKVKIKEGFWYRCQCGKVEFLDQAILAKSYQKYLKLIDSQNRCILCGSEVTLHESRGLIAELPNSNELLHIEEYLKKGKIYPTELYQEVKYWINFFSGHYILLSRVRETPYQIKYQDEHFYLDPTLFDIFSTFLEKDDVYIITGRDAVIAYAFGLLFFGKGPGHIFLPRFTINDWYELTCLSLSELILLFTGNMNWNKNKAKLNMSDLKFIRKHKSELEKKLNKVTVLDIQDVASFNRNFYSL